MRQLSQSKHGQLPSYSAAKLHLIFLKATSKVQWPFSTDLKIMCTQKMRNMVSCDAPLHSSDVHDHRSICLLQALPIPIAGVPSPCNEMGMHLLLKSPLRLTSWLWN